MKYLYFYLIALTVALLAVSCNVEHDEMPNGGNTDTNNKPSSIYKGVWAVDGVKSDSCTVDMSSKGEMIFSAMPCKEFANMLTTGDNMCEEDLLVSSDQYVVASEPSGYSESSTYMVMEPKDYCFRMTVNGEQKIMKILVEGVGLVVLNANYHTLVVKMQVRGICDVETNCTNPVIFHPSIPITLTAKL